ncbi:MAG: hypothetical protein AAB624_03670 [Patescibacteria group bacterium]
MKKLKFILIILALFAFFPVATFAIEEGETEATTEVTATEDPETVEARSERIERAKKAFPIRLNEKEKTRLSDRCAKAQEKLIKIADALDTRSLIITKKYDLIEVHLIAVQKRLTTQEIDTSIIDLLLTSFQRLTSQYDSALVDYQNALDDATQVGCTGEPEVFKALLEDVRAKRQVFVNSVEAIKNFTLTDLKTSFDALRARLKSGNEES